MAADGELTLHEDMPLEQAEVLLARVFTGERFTLPYLRWLYRDNPCGHETATNLVRDGACLAHYAAIPQAWCDGETTMRVALALNVAVADEARGRGLFLRLAEETFQRAANVHGAEAILGVGNSYTALAYPKHLHFQLVAPLPVRMGMAWGWHRPDIRAIPVADLPQSLLAGPGPGWRQGWTPESLAWRLDSPLTRFRIHHHADGAVVSCRVVQSGLPVTAIVKVLAAPGATPPVMALIAAACRASGTPLYVYAGFNRHALVPGIPLPRRLLPSPLHLVYRPMGDQAPATFSPDSFEFLDFDAY